VGSSPTIGTIFCGKNKKPLNKGGVIFPKKQGKEEKKKKKKFFMTTS
jgi:hypothetical protein